jgi:hypothetical protein
MTGEVPAAVSDAHPQWQDRSQPITVEFGPSSRFLVRMLPANRLKLAETADRLKSASSEFRCTRSAEKRPQPADYRRIRTF